MGPIKYSQNNGKDVIGLLWLIFLLLKLCCYFNIWQAISLRFLCFI